MAEFQFSIRSFAYAVKAVSDKLEEEGGATEATPEEAPVAEEAAIDGKFKTTIIKQI